VRVLDLFCGAGGAGEGYRRAGFEVVGVDIAPQPRYLCGRFIQGDVLEFGWRLLRRFDLVHFSPPCQGYTEMRHAPGAKGSAPRLISTCRALAMEAGIPYVIENVCGARWDMRDPVMLMGSHFGLCLQSPRGRLHRPRLFEASFPIPTPTPSAIDHLPVIGVYGGHVRMRARRTGGRLTSEQSWTRGVPHLTIASELMGIDWMTMTELCEAIPPDYTQYVGRAFMAWRQFF
jgi:DNA (cytosine-5)-methyltransferase 1